MAMNMDIASNAFADSGVERAANNEQWPPQHIAQYDYDAQSGANSLVEMNLDEDLELGAVEEQGLISGDMIDVDEQYKPKNDNKSPQKMQRRVKKQYPSGGGKFNRNLVMQQASGLKAHFQSKLSSESRHQIDVHRAPEANLGLCAWCVALFYWIPIRYLAFMGSMALFILPFLDVKFQSGITFVEWLLYWYIQIFALIAIFIESPTWILTRKVQLNLYKWCRLLRRTWGRSMFYISVSMLTFAELQGI